jgi:hypothetical protein
MTMTAVLGDFLGPAAEHIARAASGRDDLHAAEAGPVVAELGRVIAALGRFLGDVALPDDATPQASGDASPQATARTRQALRRSALVLRQAAESLGGTRPRGAGQAAAHPAAAHLAAAASQLAAGHDLLLDRRATGPPGPRTSAAALAGRFYWAAVATSPPVTAALLAEITGHARTLAPWIAPLSQSVPHGPARMALHDAARWLYTAAGTADAWQQHQALPPEARAALHGLPVLLIPARNPPTGPETVAELCTGVNGTTTRLRHAAVEFAPHALSSPAANSVSWQQHALAAAITTHASHLILHALFSRATRLSPGTDLCGQLRHTMELAAAAWPRHRGTSHLWDRYTTGRAAKAPLTPVAAETDHLVLRIGRLAYHDLAWAPGVAHRAQARKPDRLAPALSDIRSVAAAVHHAADAIMIIAAADRQAIEQAVQAGRVYMPCPAPAGDMLYPYVPCSASRARDVLTAYDNAIRAATGLTTALDDLAVSAALPSATLAEPRRNSPPRPGSLPPAAVTDQAGIVIPEAGQVSKLLHELRISEPAMLSRAELADTAALDLLADAIGKVSRRHNPAAASSPRRRRSKS